MFLSSLKWGNHKNHSGCSRYLPQRAGDDEEKTHHSCGCLPPGKILPRPAVPLSGCRWRPPPGNSSSLAWSSPMALEPPGWLGSGPRLGVGPPAVSSLGGGGWGSSPSQSSPVSSLLVGLTLVLSSCWGVRSCPWGGSQAM